MQSEKMEVWKTQLQEYFYNEVDITREVTDEEISEMLNAGLHALAKECYISVLERQIVKKNVFYAVRKLDVLQTLQAAILVGVSRKSMLYKPLGKTPEEVLPATVAAHMLALQGGAHILRVHDVQAAQQAIQIFQLTKR